VKFCNNRIVIGVDLGNYNMKTATVCFPSAYTEQAGDGGSFDHNLKFQERYYALGGRRVEQRDDKADVNDDFLILTLFAIARELSENRMSPGFYDIFLGVTLPPAFMKNKDMRRNLKQYFRREFSFTYNGGYYKVNIRRVIVCPQATSALYGNVLTEEMKRSMAVMPPEQREIYRKTARPIDILAKEPIAILFDIGGGTGDPAILHYGVPQPFEDDSPVKGVIFTYNHIISLIKSKHNSEISETAINMMLSGEKVRISDAQADEIRAQMERYSKQSFLQLQEKKLPFSTAYTLVLGGGAEAVRSGWSSMPGFAKLDFLTEIRANAIGSESFVEYALRKQEGEKAPESMVG
jgi:plasmid segregation protein ParM